MYSSTRQWCVDAFCLVKGSPLEGWLLQKSLTSDVKELRSSLCYGLICSTSTHYMYMCTFVLYHYHTCIVQYIMVCKLWTLSGRCSYTGLSSPWSVVHSWFHVSKTGSLLVSSSGRTCMLIFSWSALETQWIADISAGQSNHGLLWVNSRRRTVFLQYEMTTLCIVSAAYLMYMYMYMWVASLYTLMEGRCFGYVWSTVPVYEWWWTSLLLIIVLFTAHGVPLKRMEAGVGCSWFCY